MEKEIKSYMKYGTKCGIAQQVEGKVVNATQFPADHPTFPNLWRFEYGGESWVASDYAFVEEE